MVAMRSIFSEGIDLVGCQRADVILPSIVPVLTAARGSEEMDSWRHPVDLVALMERLGALELAIGGIVIVALLYLCILPPLFALLTRCRTHRRSPSHCC